VTVNPPTARDSRPSPADVDRPPTADVSGEARFVGVVHLPVDPDPPPVRGGGVVGHRRRLAAEHPGLLRLIEATAWAVGLAVVAGIAAFVAGARPAPSSAAWVNPAPTTITAVPGGGPCVFEPCAEPTYTGEPTRLRIATIGVDAPLEQLDLDSHNVLIPPKSYGKPGWFRGGILPGDAGAAVVAGHVDSYTGPAVFYQLHTLKEDDIVEVQRGGVWIRFRVTSVERYPKNRFPTEKVYMPTPGAELRLITCGGEFDRGRRSYRDNIVVYAILA
jgi:hypothetical protein